MPASRLHPDRPEALPSEPVTEQEIAALPSWARVAFDVRCVCRVVPLFHHFWPDAPAKELQRIEEALAFATEAAAHGAPPRDSKHRLHYFIQGTSAADGEIQPDASVIARAAYYAAAAAATRGQVHTATAVTAASAAVSRYQAVLKQEPLRSPLLGVFNRALRTDLRELLVRTVNERWTDETPIDPESLGPLWPESVPKSWPRVSERATVRLVESFELILGQRNEQITLAQGPIIQAFQEDLNSMEGKNLGSYEANRRIADLIQETANRLNVAFVCPKCDQPARFKCALTGNSKTGVFSFAHTKGTHGGSTTIPHLKVVMKESRRDPQP